MTEIKHFLIVDDDRQNNLLTELALRKSFAEVNITVFIVPELALEYIETKFQQTTNNVTMIILDINMPTMTGWEFIKKFNTFGQTIKKQFSIYMLSSSIDLADINRAKTNPLITDFIKKPLNRLVAAKMFG